MSLFKFVKILSGMTIIALVYIHLQMRIIDLAYVGKRHEAMIQQLKETQGHLGYEIMILESAPHIARTMLGEKSDLQFASHQAIVQVAMDLPQEQEEKSDGASGVAEPPRYSLLKLFSWGLKAEASH